MASKKPSGLGRGLGALLGDDVMKTESSGSLSLPISQVETCSSQPRKRFDDESLQELADSISQHGIIQPLTVRKLSSGYYQIIAGERRWRAARLAGLQEVPVIVIEADDRKAAELAMIENLQREDLNPMEEAAGFQSLIESYHMTQEEAAQRVGKSRSAVTNALRLLGLTPSVRKLVEEGKLSAGHARALVPLSPSLQESAASAGSYKDADGKEQPLLKAERTGLVGQAELQKILGISDEMAASLMKAPANSPVDTALEAGDRYLVVRVLTSEPSTTPSLDQARDRVMKALVAEKSLQAAMEKATAIRKAMTDGKLPAEDAARVQSADLTRDGALAGFVPNPAMNQVIFRAAPQTWIDQAFSVYEQEDSSKCGALLCRVTAVEQPKSDGWAGMENLLTELVQRKRVEGMYQTFMRMLEQKAKIEVYNSRVLESAGI